MDPDFTALASRVAARAEVLGCVILSRDGLVLGSFPPHGEMDITPGLLRFAALGDPDRGFAQFADELWAYVREGSYAAFAVAERGTRPGILLDYLEQALLVAEEARQSAAAMSEPAHVDLSKKGLGLGRRLRAATQAADEDFRASVAAPARTAESGGAPVEPPMEPPPRREVPAVDDNVLDEALAAATAAAHEPEPDPVPDEPVASFEIDPVEAAPLAAPAFHEEPPAFHVEPPATEAPPPVPIEPPPVAPQESQPEPEPPLEEPRPESEQRSEEIDRIALAREFAQLLQEGPGGAEGGQ